MRNWLLCIALLLRWMCCMSQDEITCEPPNIAHGSVSNSKAIYRNGERMQISCNEGYKPADRDEATCTRDGWNTRVECIGIVCRQPQIDHGSVRPKQLLYQYQDSIDTSCEEGYHNSGTSFCTARDWQPPPACIAKRCEYPNVQNGRVGYEWRGYFPKKPGSTIYFACNSGFLPENKNTDNWHLSYCTIRGWEPEPKCFKICDPPRRIPDGRLEAFPRPLIEGNEIAFECDPGYVSENQQTTITCTKNGWSPTPSCIAQVNAAKCGRPPSIENGDITDLVKQDYKSGERVTYKCQRYYNMEGNAAVSCQDGRWSDTPKCTAIVCQRPQIDHGSIQPQKLLYQYRDSIDTSCEERYSNTATSFCTARGWQPPPACIFNAGKCGRPPSIENGDIIELLKQEYKSGERVNYKCQRYYNMAGNKVVICQDGRWSDTPKCTAPCTASEEDMERNNIRLMWSTAEKLYAEDGDTTEFACKRGFSPAVPTSRFRVHCVNGIFEYPRCE